LIEMLIVMGLLAVVTGISYPSLSAGLTSLRLRSSANSIATFLTGAVDRAERSQQAVQVIIYPKESVITAISSDSSFQKKLELGDGISIVNVLPALVSSNGEPVRRTFVIYPGGPAPRIGIEIAGSPTAHRIVALDPLTGFSRTVQP
jgi:hypothetical protein